MRLLFTLFFLAIVIICSSQNALDILIDDACVGKPLSECLSKIQQKNPVRYFFLEEWIKDKIVTENSRGQTLRYVFDALLSESDLVYFEMYDNTIVIIKDAALALKRREALVSAVKSNLKIDKIILGSAANASKGEVVVHGSVLAARSKDVLPYATIRVLNSDKTATANDKGQFDFALMPGPYVIQINYVDYEPIVIDLQVYAGGEFKVELEESSTMLNDILIEGNRNKDVSTSRMGQIQMSMKNLKKLPSLLGELDLVKQVQTLAGVTTVGEAASGFNVRGGSVDQNLILYDGIPIYNSTHAFGFFSAFNSESIRDVNFYKGGIPSEYGGRISSVLDIKSKDGSMNQWNGSAGIGLLTGNFMINGPIKKDKTSISASFRSTYSNWLIHSIKTDYINLKKSDVYFYDGNLKVAHNLSNRTKITASVYSSHDGFTLSGDSTYQWANFSSSANVNHQFNDRLNADFVFGTGRYHYNLINNDPETASTLSYSITTPTLKAGFHLEKNEHKYNFGLNGALYDFRPGSYHPSSPESNANDIELQKQNSLEIAFYAGDEWTISDKILLEGGLRLPVFFSYGKANINIYDGSRDVANVQDTLHFKSGQTIKGYFGIEPRLSVRYKLNASSSFKFGYNRMYQYLHLVTNTAAITPIDIWQPSGYYFKPQSADQVSGGFFHDWFKQKIGVSGELFYKAVNNILDFKDGAQLILNKHLETDLVQGRGYSYGAELSLYKNEGRLAGTLNYTYARSFRKIAGPTSAESINNGSRYPANYDQPHIINLSWKYNITKRYFFTGNFTYHTGRPITIPLSVINWENTTVAYFSARNQYRIPSYHRLDVALVLEGNHKRNKHIDGTWVISLYNVYARKNPYTIFFKSDATQVPKPYQLSIIGTIFPSISYNLKFK